MTVNLAKVFPWVVLLAVLGVWALTQTSGEEQADDYDYSYGYADRGRADSYLDGLAVRLAQPGVYVDPSVVDDGRLSEDEVTRLDELAARTPGPVRVAVVPADALRGDDPSDPGTSAYSNPIPYDPDELVGQLYERVGVDGTYAILVDASSQSGGRSFTAYQWSEERPFYEVEEAVDEAVDCCAPDYDAMVTRFLERTGEEQTNPWPIVGWVVAGVAALVGLLLGGRKWRRRRAQQRDDEEVADMLRPSLQEEVVELSGTVSALPPAPAGGDHADAIANATRQVLDLVEEARHRLDVEDGSARMDTPSEVEDVVRRLADARWQLVAIEAYRQGQEPPIRTAPCFFDPRHGPSVADRPFTPEFGAERQVPVCARCAEEVDAGQEPAVRTLTLRGLVKPYWEWDRYTRPYVNGYWQRHAFADQRVQRARTDPAPTWSRSSSEGSGWSGLQFVWEADDSGSSSGGGGRGFSGSSRSRSSFGGGSSRRSTRRSGGSRGF